MRAENALVIAQFIFRLLNLSEIDWSKIGQVRVSNAELGESSNFDKTELPASHIDQDAPTGVSLLVPRSGPPAEFAVSKEAF